MSNKCSKCGLVNWAQETHCRRCGVELSGAGQSEFASLRSKIQAEDFKSGEDHDPAFDEAKALIKKGVNAGMVYGGISLVLVLFFQAFIPSAEAYYKFAFLDVGIIYGLTYGIHTKNRVCAALMLGYYIVSKIIMLTQGRTGLIGIVVAIAFAKSFYQSYQGTTLYHRIKQSRTTHPHV